MTILAIIISLVAGAYAQWRYCVVEMVTGKTYGGVTLHDREMEIADLAKKLNEANGA